MKSTVLVVDDEPQMTAILSFAFETHGFEAICAGTAREAWEILERNEIDLVVLDVMLPDQSGFRLTERIRAQGHDVPVILLTALVNERDRIRGLEAGADDYVGKPFSPRELTLRAQAVLRRTQRTGESHEDALELGALRLDLRSERAWWEGRRIDVGSTEFRVLATLAEHSPHPVGPHQLLNEAWATTATVGGREMIKTAVYRLRRHLRQAGVDPSLVTSVRGQGYRLVVA
ncbi:MAG: response regulator transcription factor [Galactobacter sp.]